MPNYKLVDGDRLDATFRDIAGAVREKRITETRYADTELAQAIRDIPTGGQAPEGSAVLYLSNAAQTDLDWKALPIEAQVRPWIKLDYNGTILPLLPGDFFSGQYPYALIHRGSTRYNVLLSKNPYYLDTNPGDTYTTRLVSSGSSCAVWWLTLEEAGAATHWDFRNNTTYWWSVENGQGVVWANYDIRRGSASGEDIFFHATDLRLSDA